MVSHKSGHSNNTWHSRGRQRVTWSLLLLKLGFKAFGSKKTFLIEQALVSRDTFFQNYFTIWSLKSLKSSIFHDIKCHMVAMMTRLLFVMGYFNQRYKSFVTILSYKKITSKGKNIHVVHVCSTVILVISCTVC